MIINHNLNAMNAHRNMGINTVNSGKSMEKLSSGLRINRAGDDAAGLAISEKMRGQIRGLDQAGRNAQDGISMIQTAEGALNETHSILQRMRELGVQSSNDTNTSVDRDEIQKEINQLTNEINRIGNNTEFNTQKLLNGSKTAAQIKGSELDFSAPINTASKITITVGSGAAQAVDFTGGINDMATLKGKFGGVTGVTVSNEGNRLIITASNPSENLVIATTAGNAADLAKVGLISGTTNGGQAASLQIGANQSQQFSTSINDMRAYALGISGTNTALFSTSGTALTETSVASGSEYALDVSTAAKATKAISIIDNASTLVSSERSKLGAYQNRLEHTIANLGTASENLTSAESRIRDVDMAKEMMSFSKNNILSQAAQAMLAQANQQPQGVLQLLR